MQIKNVNNINFGRFDKSSAQCLLGSARNESEIREYGALIAKNHYNPFYNITKVDKGWKIVRNNEPIPISLSPLKQDTFETAKEAVETAQKAAGFIQSSLINSIRMIALYPYDVINMLYK